MAIIKRSRSGKAILFVDDDGNCYMTSTKYAKGIVEGTFKGFGLLTRFPNKVKEGLFKKSPLVGETYSDKYSDVDPFTSANKVEKMQRESKIIEDLEGW